MPATFNNVPFRVGQTAWLDKILADARTAVRSLGWFSDSRGTSPGGAGTNLYRHLNKQFYARYGNVPQTDIHPFGYDPGSVFYTGNDAEGRGIYNYLPADTVPPGMIPTRFQVPPGAGPVNAFDFTDSRVAGQTLASNFFNVDLTNIAAQPWLMRLYGVTDPGSTEFSVRFQQSAGLNYFDTIVQTFTPTTLALNAAQGDVHNQAIPATYSAGVNANTTMTVYPYLAAGNAVLLGSRWENPNKPYGMAIQPHGLGGYSMSSFIALHNNCGKLLTAEGLNFAAILFGANDFANGVTAAQIRDNCIAMIRRIRVLLGNQSFPFVLYSDIYRTGLTGAQQIEHDQSAGAMAEVAGSEPYCVALNLQRLTRNSGLNATNNAWALADGVHWTEDGAAAVADAAVALLYVDAPLNLFSDTDRSDLEYIRGQVALIEAGPAASAPAVTGNVFDPVGAETGVYWAYTFTAPLIMDGWVKASFTIKRDIANDDDSEALLTLSVSNPAVPATDGIKTHNRRPIAAADDLRTAGTISAVSTNPTTALLITLLPEALQLPPSPDTAPYACEINYWLADGIKRQMGRADFNLARSVRRGVVAP